jgi:hypothetical protein
LPSGTGTRREGTRLPIERRRGPERGNRIPLGGGSFRSPAGAG